MSNNKLEDRSAELVDLMDKVDFQALKVFTTSLEVVVQVEPEQIPSAIFSRNSRNSLEEQVRVLSVDHQERHNSKPRDRILS